MKSWRWASLIASLLSLMLLLSNTLTAVGQYEIHTTTRNPVNNSITALCEDTNGFMWIGTEQGACLWRAQENQFITLESGLQRRSVKTFCEISPGVIAAGTSRGIFLIDSDYKPRYIRDTVERILMNENILHSALDPQGNLWLGGTHGIHKITFRSDGEIASVSSSVKNRQIGYFAFDPLGRLWSSDGEKHYIMPPGDTIPDRPAYAINVRLIGKGIVFHENEAWIVTSYNGIVNLALNDHGAIIRRKEQWINPDRSNVTNLLSVVHLDRHENIWIGGADGLYILTPQKHNNFGQIVAGPAPDGLSHNVVSDVKVDRQGNIWASSSQGVNKIVFQEGKPIITHYLYNLESDRLISDNSMQQLIIDPHNILWIGTRRGIVRFKPAYTNRYTGMEIATQFPKREARPAENAPRIFIFSDDDDMVNLLRFVLGEYAIERFTTPQQLIETSLQHTPQLIIADTVARNEESGVELILQLKENSDTNHFPVILFTAEETQEKAELFYRMGIDSFMEKPFDSVRLRAVAHQLIQSRINLKEKFKMEMIFAPKNKHIESADEKFISRVMEVIEENIPNEDFNLIDFAKLMHMSRSALHAKIQMLASRSPIELLRYIRMQKAAQLLLSEAFNISQVGYMVGFSDSRYFSTCFKKQFSVTPREYISRHKIDKELAPFAGKFDDFSAKMTKR